MSRLPGRLPDPGVRRPRVPVLTAGIPRHPAGRTAARRERAVRVSALPADRHPSARPRRRRGSGGCPAGRFWDIHDLLFHRQNELGESDLVRYTAQLGLDAAAFDTDRTSVAVLERIRRVVASGLASGQVLGTPMLFIDGVVHRGGYDPRTLPAALTP